GIVLREVATAEGSDPEYIANRGRSCFHCKTHLYSTLGVVAATAAAASDAGRRRVVLFNGTNKDDRRDPTRVGLVAASDFGVASPIDTLTKDEVRSVAHELGLPNWDAAASPCLRSRLALGVAATPLRLQRIEAAESLVRTELGLGATDNLRVRTLLGESAIVEVDGDRLGEATRRLETLRDGLLPLGFASLQVKSFRSGSVSG
ncbi:unnamed protein product, partial [Phaeothamnion confervicola]